MKVVKSVMCGVGPPSFVAEYAIIVYTNSHWAFATIGTIPVLLLLGHIVFFKSG